jgi:hypothetical protein
MGAPAPGIPPLGRAAEAARQIGVVVDHIAASATAHGFTSSRTRGAPLPPDCLLATMPTRLAAWYGSVRSRNGRSRDCRRPARSGHGGTYR